MMALSFGASWPTMWMVATQGGRNGSLKLVVTFFLLPPVNLLLLSLAGFVLSRRRSGWQRTGRILCGLGLAGLLVFTLPITSMLMTVAIEEVVPPSPEAPAPAAIVILSGDMNWDVDDVGPLSLERERAGAAVQRATGLPVLVSGGVIRHGRSSLAVLMTRSLETDFATPVRWREESSRNTWENARYSAALLQAEGIRSVFLVTHAWHMRRALISFRYFGVVATPAPVPFSPTLRLQLSDFVPSAGAWLTSYYAVHEWVGCAWYALWARS
jgi:uncharacterized SAM-binding protein YcdF (DUF218 family)